VNDFDNEPIRNRVCGETRLPNPSVPYPATCTTSAPRVTATAIPGTPILSRPAATTRSIAAESGDVGEDATAGNPDAASTAMTHATAISVRGNGFRDLGLNREQPVDNRGMNHPTAGDPLRQCARNGCAVLNVASVLGRPRRCW
jgi:hypothetical protein